MNNDALRQVALAPRLAYSRRLLEETASSIAAYQKQWQGRSPDVESERTILFCLEAVQRAYARLHIQNIGEIPHLVPPVVWVLRTVSAGLSGYLPRCSAKLSELAVHLGSIAMDASLLAGVDIHSTHSESGRLLESARSAAEAGTKKLYPDVIKVGEPLP